MPSLFSTSRALALLAALGFGAAAAQTPPPAPKIQFEEIRHDFGRVLAGTVVHHEYVFTNVGDADLIITNVVPSCGCTTTPDWSSEVPPGGQGRVPLQFNSTGMLGQVQRSLAIYSNDAAQPVVALTLESLVWQPIELHPSVAVIQMPPRTDHTFSTTIRIVNQTDQPLELRPPVSSVPLVRARLQEVTPGKEFYLIIDLDPPPTHENINATITFATSSAEVPEIVVPVIVIAEPEIVVSPTQMFLPAVPPDFPEPYVISVRNQAPEPITLDRASCDAPGAKVEIREITPGRDFELAVSFPADFGYIPDQTYSITAHTSHPDHPQIRIGVGFATPPSQIPPRRR